ncbi:MAG: VanZ family protein [Sneathiellales bacterium]|nr:VanZ family protein [Sneathiellales bacterium]
MLVLIGVGSLTPVDNLPKEPSLISDKMQHFAGYLILTLFACFASNHKNTWLVLVIVSIGFGVAIEFIQPVTGRHFEIADMVANISGSAFAVLVSEIFKKTSYGILLLK